MKKFLELITVDAKMEVSMNQTSIEVYDYFASDAIEFFGIGGLLDEIGIEEVKKHFDLVEVEDRIKVV